MVSGKWNLTLVCHTEIAETPVTCDKPVGLDVGLETFVTLSTVEKIAPPKFFRKQEAKIKRAHRRVSRTQKHSRNRAKARRRLSRIYEKVRNRHKTVGQNRSLDRISLCPFYRKPRT